MLSAFLNRTLMTQCQICTVNSFSINRRIIIGEVHLSVAVQLRIYFGIVLKRKQVEQHFLKACVSNPCSRVKIMRFHCTYVRNIMLCCVSFYWQLSLPTSSCVMASLQNALQAV